MQNNSMVHSGLAEEEVLELRKIFGENVLPSKEGRVWLGILFSQIKNPFIFILLSVALISLIFKEFVDVGLLVAVAVLNITMGFYQEYSAHKTLRALRSFLKSFTTVIRAGKRKTIETKALVPDDLVVLGAGDKVPADGIFLEGVSLTVNEAILTGEEEAVVKTIDGVGHDLFMGTTVVSGFGLMKVEKTGLMTEIGKISSTLQIMKEDKTPFQKKLENFSRNLALIIVIICLLIFSTGVFVFHRPLLEMFRIAVILSVAAIPEGLPIAMTVIMALGMRRILKRQGLVKKLISLEILGSVSVILTDKTGTLTEGVTRVVKTDFTNQEKALLVLNLTNSQRMNLEIALWQYLKKEVKEGPQNVFDKYPRVFNEPFSSENKYEFTINQTGEGLIACLVGAPEIILSFCALNSAEKKTILAKIDQFASEGLRLLGVAFKEGDSLEKLKIKKDFKWLGLVAVKDPLRTEVPEAVKKAQEAGIKIKIVTGDYRKTAEKAAQQLGLAIGVLNVIEGKELEIMADAELEKRIDDITVFCRVSPHQKLKIVKALKSKGEVVAMIGDGVNDALALKRADIGVVVGSASDVAKETSDVILLDNNFKTILAAVEEGRLAFSNIKKVAGYVLSNCFAEIILIFGAMLLRLPIPLLIAQILWIHLICDGPPDILLSFEPKEPNLMKKSPKEMVREQILSNSMKFLIAAVSLAVGLLSLFFFQVLQDGGGNLTLARTVAFATIGAVSLIYIFSFKNLQEPFFKTKNFFANKPLFLGVLYGFVLLLIGIYVPFFNKVLGTTPLGISHWLLVFSAGFVAVFLVELVKSLERRKKSVFN